ncbi:MAG TPA: hypothetical protein VNT53_00390 [Pseudolysinimonas sp.]|nr:hypothetical protein [Pseudolysinimonas sp.]
MTDNTPLIQPDLRQLPTENVPRGTILALIVIPLGIVVWVALWSVGFIASLVAFGVAWGAVRLYRLGSGGRVSRTGAIRVTIITIATMLLAFFAGVVWDNIGVMGAIIDRGQFGEYLVVATMANGVSFLIALAFGALGCFGVLRAAFAQSRPAPTMAPAVPPAPQPPAPPA